MIIIEVFHFYATCFILPLLLRTFFKTVREILHLLTVYPKSIFRGALKKAFMVLEKRSYQTQYFAKTFPNPLASTLHIHFYLHLKESSEHALWIAIALKSATFSASESAPKVHSKLRILCYFLKTLLKIWRKADNRVCFNRTDQFYTYFFFLLAISFVIGGNSTAMHGWRMIVFMKQHLHFFSQSTPDCLYLLKILLESFFAVISSQNLKIQMKIASHAWLVIAPSENYFAF